MIVSKITKSTVYYLETEDDYYSTYTRHGNNNWTVRMGESDEPVYDDEEISELETAFKKWCGENGL